MLNKLKLYAGTSVGSEPLEVNLSSMTVFVGPNNSGKSQALREIESWFRSPKPVKGLVIQRLEFEGWNEEEIAEIVDGLEVEPRLNESLQTDHILIEKLNPQTNATNRIQIHRPGLLQEAKNPNAARQRFTQFTSLYTLKLDGTNRLALVNEQNAGDLLGSPPNLLAHLCKNSNARRKLRNLVFDSFGKHLVVDPTNIGKLRLRLSARAPETESEELGWDSSAQRFHKNASLITEASDGVKAFVGILASIIGGDPKVTLLDEPEAFLHPALSSKLGQAITTELAGSKKRIFVSTHSASFLMGCFQAGANINIIRLTYNNDQATARILKREQLKPLMMNPLLRSVGVLNALFYNFVIVTESDADRSFYQEINERLLKANDPRGINGCLFLNAQNKQTVWDIVKPLRELGIPAAGVVDIDVIKDGGRVWRKPLEGAFVPDISHASLQTERQSILRAFTETGKDMKRDGGISLLSDSDREACLNLLDGLNEYGIFVVPNGELESWLASFSVCSNKSTWLFEIFEKMGDDPEDRNYLMPSEGDVWEFIGSVGAWLKNEKRKGIPK